MSPPPASILLFLCITTVSCAHHEPTPPPSQVDKNIDRALDLLKSGRLHLDQPVSDAIQQSHPLHVYNAPPYTFIEFDDVPSLGGLSLIARNGKLAWATYWTCTQSRQFFSNFTPREQEAAFDVYENRVLAHLSNQQ